MWDDGDPPRRGKGGGKGPLWLWFVVAALALGALFYWLSVRFPGVLSGGEGSDKAWALHHLILLAVLGGALVVRIRARPGAALRHAAIWVVVGAGLILAYSFKDEFIALKDRLVAELSPTTGRVEQGGSVIFQRARGGHFQVEAEIDGQPIRFLVDTGASLVVLSPDDAARLGFDLDRLDYSQVFNTANGQGRGAPVRLAEIRVGPIVARDVRASVNQAPMGGSLLGMTFLDRLSGFQVEGDRLTLYP